MGSWRIATPARRRGRPWGVLEPKQPPAMVLRSRLPDGTSHLTVRQAVSARDFDLFGRVAEAGYEAPGLAWLQENQGGYESERVVWAIVFDGDQPIGTACGFADTTPEGSIGGWCTSLRHLPNFGAEEPRLRSPAGCPTVSSTEASKRSCCSRATWDSASMSGSGSRPMTATNGCRSANAESRQGVSASRAVEDHARYQRRS